MTDLFLWGFNPITGTWKIERYVLPETADQWLRIFQEDEPERHFKISRRKPKENPTKRS